MLSGNVKKDVSTNLHSTNQKRGNITFTNQKSKIAHNSYKRKLETRFPINSGQQITLLQFERYFTLYSLV